MMEGKIKPCAYCGLNLFVPRGTSRKYHTVCAKKVANKKKHERMREECQAGMPTGKWAVSDKEVVDRTRVRTGDIAADARAAREAGLTYGQWRALQMKQ